MLYIQRMSKTIFPEAVQPGPHYSFRADMKLNAWALMALVVAMVSRWWLQHHHDWGAWVSGGIALSPLLPSVLYVRSLSRWIGGMDELQRRIQLEACLFATTGMVLIATALSLLSGYGLLESSWVQHGLGWEGSFAGIVGLYIVGNVLSCRRYR